MKLPEFHIQHKTHRQTGAALFIALVFLVVLTMLSLSAMRTNIIEERMAGNARDRNVALQAAEAALRDAERDIRSGRVIGDTGFVAGCNTTTDYIGLCAVEADGSAIWVDITTASNGGWMQGNDVTPSIKYGTKTGGATVNGVEKQPRYIIEAIAVPMSGSRKPGFNPSQSNYLYRVTAVGFGAKNANSRVVLQAVYRQ